MSQQISLRAAAFQVLAAIAAICLARADEAEVTRVAFGSCCHQSRNQAIWTAIAAQKPDLFLFMGDNIYGDSRRMDVLRERYGRLLAQPDYRAMQAGGCRVLATWDDHDYGENDAGAEFPVKAESQRVFLESFAVPKERGPWSRPGIYDSYVFGPEGRRLQVILLDTRYFRSKLLRMEVVKDRMLGRYAENTAPDATILGSAQWTWLEAQLRQPAELRLIVSSIQLLAVDHFWERWQNFPRERERFLRLLRETGAKNTLILSGDRHLAEIMRLPEDDALSPGFPLHEITSSGLNQTFDEGGGEPNRYRVGENFTAANFGLLAVDWEARQVRGEIRDRQGKVVRTVAIRGLLP